MSFSALDGSVVQWSSPHHQELKILGLILATAVILKIFQYCCEEYDTRGRVTR